MKAEGERAGKGKRPGREYDGYAVGRRVLRIAPAWLLLVVAGFALALLLFSWLGRRSAPRGEAFRNEATNQTPSPVEAVSAVHPGAKTPPAKEAVATPTASEPVQPAATPDAAAVGVSEAEAYSVQVGAFADLSQANEQVSRLRAAGFEARVVEAAEATHFRFQVRSGLYTTREEAARLASSLHVGGVAGDTVIIDPEKK